MGPGTDRMASWPSCGANEDQADALEKALVASPLSPSPPDPTDAPVIKRTMELVA